LKIAIFKKFKEKKDEKRSIGALDMGGDKNTR
jgi:hypothetical protein